MYPSHRIPTRLKHWKCPMDWNGIYLVFDFIAIFFPPLFQRCFPESHCRPKASKLERVSTIQGVRVIEVTEACECTSDSSCRRESFTHLVHSGTPHQAVMDVGVCMGHCAKGIFLLSSFTRYRSSIIVDNRRSTSFERSWMQTGEEQYG